MPHDGEEEAEEQQERGHAEQDSARPVTKLLHLEKNIFNIFIYNFRTVLRQNLLNSIRCYKQTPWG